MENYRKFLDRAAIDCVRDLKQIVVEVPEWNGFVRLQELTCADREKLENAFNGSGKHLREIAVALSAIDETGQRLFTDSDIAILSKKSGKAIDRLFSAIIGLNKLKKSEIDELEKN